MSHARPPDPEYGPRGYLPDRAAKRARKIILREQMGLGWPVAAVVAAVLLAILGIVYLVTQTGPPGPPHRELGALEDFGSAAAVEAAGDTVLVVRAGGGVRAFAHPGAAVTWCPASRRLEGRDGTVWTVTGRLVGGDGRSLAPLPVQVHDGRLFVDPSNPLRPPAPHDAGEVPACT